MAGSAPARARASDRTETTAAFMARRNLEAAQRDEDEAAGRSRWEASTASGGNLWAARPSDVRALGAARGRRAADATVPPSTGETWQPSAAGSGGRYGALIAPPPGDLEDLRRRQAEFARVTREIDQRNSWFAVPALAPEAVVDGLEIAGAIAARFAAPEVARAPLVLTQRDPHLRVGDFWATRAGRRAHDAFAARVNAKTGWRAEEPVVGKSGAKLRPDARTPARNPLDDKDRFVIELKPDTPSGRRAGAKAAKKYFQELNRRTRVVFYDPKDFI